MPRIKAAKRSELELFWRGHLEGWRRSELNQREYCELHGLPLQRFGNWRAKLKAAGEERPHKLLYRRGGGLKHMPEHILSLIGKRGGVRRATSLGAVAAAGWPTPVRKADKKRIAEEASQSGASVSSVARRYGIGARLLFHWTQELEESAPTEARFLPVQPWMSRLRQPRVPHQHQGLCSGRRSFLNGSQNRGGTDGRPPRALRSRMPPPEKAR